MGIGGSSPQGWDRFARKIKALTGTQILVGATAILTITALGLSIGGIITSTGTVTTYTGFSAGVMVDARPATYIDGVPAGCTVDGGDVCWDAGAPIVVTDAGSATYQEKGALTSAGVLTVQSIATTLGITGRTLTLTYDGLTSSTPGLTLQNTTTTAGVGAPTIEQAPGLVWKGSAEDTDDNTSHTVEFLADVTPVSSGSPYANFLLRYRYDGGAWGSALAVSSAGAVTAYGGFVGYLADSGTATQPAMLYLSHNTSGTADVGLGSAIYFRAEDAGGQTNENQGALLMRWSDATADSEDATFAVQLRTAGAAIADKLTLTSTGDLTVTGDLAAAGGFRSTAGPFAYSNIAATQTDLAATYGISGGEWTATRAGSIVGLGVKLSENAAGSAIVVEVQKNQSHVIANGVSIAAGAASGSAVFDKGTYTFVAGDRLRVTVTTDGSWSSTNADAVVTLEVEQ